MNKEELRLICVEELKKLSSEQVEQLKKEIKLYREKKEKIINFLMGIVMKETRGAADPIMTREIINKILDEEYNKLYYEQNDKNI